MNSRGHFFDARELRATPVELSADNSTLRVTWPDGSSRSTPLRELRFSDRLGQVPRFVYFPDESCVETPDNDAIDALLARRGRGRLAALIHLLEQHERLAAVATVLLVSTVAAALFYGSPVAARHAAQAVPEGVEQHAGRQAYEAFKQFMAPSTLTQFEQDRIRHQAAKLATRLQLPQPPQVRFHQMGQHPNAFALPGGTIVLTDELVKLATEDELAAVLAHEFAHWQKRHALQSIFRDSAALLVVTGVTGDLSTLTAFAATIPLTLLQRGYSREFETEADVDAIESLRRAGIDPRHMASVLHKLATARAAGPQDYSYLSTHPATPERMKRADPDGTYEQLAREEQPLTFSALDEPPRFLSRRLPVVPIDAPALKDTVRATVDFVVTRTGTVVQPEIREPIAEPYQRAVREALVTWTLEPGTKAKQPAAVRSHATIIFAPNSAPLVATEISHRPRHGSGNPRSPGATSLARIALPAALPVYTPEMLAARATGEVTVEVIVSETGAVTDTRVVESTNRALNEAALAAAREWKFIPARRSGSPSKTTSRQTLRFSPEDGGQVTLTPAASHRAAGSAGAPQPSSP